MICADLEMLEAIYKGLLGGEETPENIEKRAKYL